jgi:hypothetical protein
MKYSKLASTMILVGVAMLLSCEQGMNLEIPVDSTTAGNIALTNSQTNQTLITNYTFSGAEGDPIPFETAKTWISNYQSGNPIGTKAHFFGFEILKQILAEPTCVGIRMYYALDDKGQRQIILVGVNADGENLLPQSQSLRDGDGNIVADASYPCPSFCPGGTGV